MPGWGTWQEWLNPRLRGFPGRGSPPCALSPPALRLQPLGLSPRGPARGGTPWAPHLCVGVPPGPCCSQAGSPLLSFLGKGGSACSRHRLAAHGALSISQGRRQPAHLLCAPRPRLPRSSGGDRGENSPILRGVCCLLGRQETRENWLKKPVRLGRLQASPGQSGGCQAGSGGGEPGAGLRPVGGIQRGGGRRGQRLAGLH